jgi:ATP-dependent DNA helicase RecG
LSVSIAQLDVWIRNAEDEHLEFKEARTQYSTEELVRYCTALANECGGNMVLGVTNKKPRQVVGTNAFADLNSIKATLVERLRLHVEVGVVDHPNGRVVVFEVPSRPVGMPIPYKGAYLMRAGEDLVHMTPDRLKRIFEEAGPDFSAMICSGATLFDLDPGAIENFRAMWKRKSGNSALDTLTPEQLLIDAELIVDGEVTYAALVLLGTHRGLGKYLPQAEVIFEYRASEAEIPYRQRKEYRLGFFRFQEDLWQTIDARNEVHHFEDGLFVGDIPTFDGRIVREALLNAISHRDYRLAGSTFVRQFPSSLEIVSPGGFAPGVTPENILWKQVPRNRRIAEVFSKSGLVERSGQGTRLMLEWSIRESKPRPDYSRSDDHEVVLTLRGEVRDSSFLDFLEKISKETLSSFSTQDFMVVDLIYQEQPLPQELHDRLPRLIELGVIEAQGRGRGTRYFISRRFYDLVGKKGTYTRKRGLDRETNKALLFKHIQDNKEEGSRFEELSQVLPAHSRGAIQRLMGELKDEGRIHVVGRTKAARWYPGSAKQDIAS